MVYIVFYCLIATLFFYIKYQNHSILCVLVSTRDIKSREKINLAKRDIMREMWLIPVWPYLVIRGLYRVINQKIKSKNP